MRFDQPEADNFDRIRPQNNNVWQPVNGNHSSKKTCEIIREQSFNKNKNKTRMND